MVSSGQKFDQTKRNQEIFALLAKSALYIGIGAGLGYAWVYTLRILMSDGSSAEKKSAVAALVKKLGRTDISTADLNQYEIKFVQDVIGSDELGVSFSDIGGMEAEIEKITDNVVLPMRYWRMFKEHSDILPCPTGVLLYGKPGTGKTMIAKAIAKGEQRKIELFMNCLHVSISLCL